MNTTTINKTRSAIQVAHFRPNIFWIRAGSLTPLELQSRLGDNPLEFQVIFPICPQNETAVLTGLAPNRRNANRISNNGVFFARVMGIIHSSGCNSFFLGEISFRVRYGAP